MGMKSHPFALAGTVAILGAALVGSRGEKLVKQPAAVKLPTAFGAIQPRLSPDGNTIAFSYQGEIWTGPRTGGTMTLLTASQGEDTEPAWSPDGSRIAFLRAGLVKVAQFPGGEDVPLQHSAAAQGTYAVNKLEFSADGKRLLGAFRVPGRENSLAWFDLASGELTALVPVSYCFRFALAPDGQWIVHTTHPDQPGEQSGNNGSHTDLWKLPVSGGQGLKLCRFPARVNDLCCADGGKAVVVAAELGQAHNDLWKLPLDDPLAAGP